MIRVCGIGVLAAALASAANIAPSYAGSYNLTDLGLVPGVPSSYGESPFARITRTSY
jgi:hypothetical protein